MIIATSSDELTCLHYQGIDIVLDRDLGPLVLELNASPGLGIQIANSMGLDKRLETADQHWAKLKNLAERVACSQEHFAVL
ncbi:MAG: hypothetical protein HQL69_17355 [Magnetococcales bacterium]|nr:hypothetical protein [Magnetococcales bacterium]